MEIEGAIFDMDGTLLDSMPIWRTLTTRYIRSLGVSIPDGLDDEIGYPVANTVNFLRNNYGIRKTVRDVLDGRRAILEQFYFHQATAKPGVQDYLEKLSRRGVRMCVVTQTERTLSAGALEHCGLLGYFLQVISCRDFGSGKDQPDVFEHALGILGTRRERTPVFEDAFYAAKTAKAAGFPVIAVEDASCWDPARLNSIADRYVRSMRDLD